MYFNPGLQDPFNSPKLWLLILFGSWLTGYIFNGAKLRILRYKLTTNLLILSLCSFIISLLVSTLATDMKFTAIFGETGRRIGFTTYLFFAVYLYASYRFISFKYFQLIFKTVMAIAVINIAYGFMQYSGNDFTQWNNPYNSIFTTFGNPNYASAAMAMFSVVCFSALFVAQLNWFFKVSCLAINIALLFLIYLSDSRQGLVSYGLGISVVIVVVAFSRNKNLGVLSLAIFSALAGFTILGMLQSGPLEKYLYKPSVSVRGYYWRAGLEMFKDNPITGVGIDRFGVYFKDFREVGYPLNYGFEITSTNAHSIPIQLFATGGLFVGLFHLLLTLYIFYCGIYSIKNNIGINRFFITGIFSAWISYQAQALISIENIGLGIWGWVFGGVLAGVARLTKDKVSNVNNNLEDPKTINARSYNFKISQPLISGSFSLFAIVLVSLLYSGDRVIIESRQYFNGTSASQSELFYSKIDTAYKNSFADPYNKFLVSDMLAQSGDKNRALKEIIKLHDYDPKNLDYIRPLAILFEKSNDVVNAVKFRNLIAKYDPWNAENYLFLGLNYKSVGDFESMDEMRKRIIEIAPNHSIATSANELLQVGR